MTEKSEAFAEVQRLQKAVYDEQQIIDALIAEYHTAVENYQKLNRNLGGEKP